MKNLLFIIALFSFSAHAEWMETKESFVQIDQLCPEGYVSCDIVHLVEQNKQSGEVSIITGSTKHVMCADGVTPCRFDGYRFITEKSELLFTPTEFGYSLEEKSLKSDHWQREQQVTPVKQDISSLIASPSCYTSTSAYIDLFRANSPFAKTYWLVSYYDGKPCDQATLHVRVVSANNTRAAWDITSVDFWQLTMHDETFEQYQDNLQLAERKMTTLAEDVAQYEAWPEYTTTSTVDLYEEEAGGALEFGISKEEYAQFVSSGANFFSFRIGSSPQTAFAFDVVKNTIVEVSAKPR